MFRWMRTAIAAVLALTVAALPLMLDRCSESCDAHQSAVATTPACHHASSSGMRLTNVPASCGHDHNAGVVTAAKTFAPTDRAFALTALPGHQFSSAPPVEPGVRVDPHALRDPSPPLAARSLPLRV